MPELFNLTNLTDSTNLLAILQFNNEVTGGLFAIALIMTFFAVSYISLKNFPPPQAFAGSCYSTFVITAIFRLIGLVPNYLFLLMIILTAISSLIMIKYN